MEALTCVESVLCFPRSLTHPRSRALRQHLIKQAAFSLIGQQTTAKFDSGQKSQTLDPLVPNGTGIFPINARPDGIGCLPIG